MARLGASATVLERGQLAVGVNNSTDFIRPVVVGSLHVVAIVIQQGDFTSLTPITKTVARFAYIATVRSGCQMMAK